ncbi:MAG: hypothetical protein HLUCCO02_08990 [Idiomarinaceae bacterium HL-53]|nr:MAG: hypothetical protein HLUCCO02_08990 [Idiomarinaceae bacterium HL-53]CUS47667.1 hypothetical protein Ga0003345_0600 [Idiomarinaceae bacterium HL-53]
MKRKSGSSSIKWDNRELGASEEYVGVVEASDEIEDALNEACRLTTVSLRLEDELLSELRFIADCNQVSHQALVRHLLKKFVVSQSQI